MAENHFIVRPKLSAFEINQSALKDKMKIAEMLMNRKTRDYLVASWSDIKKVDLVQIEKNTLNMLYTLLVMAFLLVFWSAFFLIIGRTPKESLDIALLLSFTVVSIVILIFTFLEKKLLKIFEKDSDNLFWEMGADIKLCNSFDEIKRVGFSILVTAAERCLWLQTHRADQHQLIAEAQERFRHLFDLFGKFGLLETECQETGYKIYYEEATKRSEVPDWFLKMDPSIPL